MFTNHFAILHPKWTFANASRLIRKHFYAKYCSCSLYACIVYIHIAQSYMQWAQIAWFPRIARGETFGKLRFTLKILVGKILGGHQICQYFPAHSCTTKLIIVRMRILFHNFAEESTSVAEQKVHITPNKVEFLQAMISSHNDDYEVFLNDLCSLNYISSCFVIITENGKR